jgi:hypothetical protein
MRSFPPFVSSLRPPDACQKKAKLLLATHTALRFGIEHITYYNVCAVGIERSTVDVTWRNRPALNTAFGS